MHFNLLLLKRKISDRTLDSLAILRIKSRKKKSPHKDETLQGAFSIRDDLIIDSDNKKSRVKQSLESTDWPLLQSQKNSNLVQPSEHCCPRTIFSSSCLIYNENKGGVH